MIITHLDHEDEEQWGEKRLIIFIWRECKCNSKLDGYNLGIDGEDLLNTNKIIEKFNEIKDSGKLFEYLLCL